MATGLKQMVQRALAQQTNPDLPPVDISVEAHRVLTERMREWSGWPDATVLNGKPHVSPWAECDHSNHRFTVNVDRLALNPHRVLINVTPFRLKQEAVLTGALLHEAGHARYSHWRPRTEEAAAKWVHPDGKPVTLAEADLAALMEEPRIEGLVARDVDKIGATGLDWTLRATAAHLIPVTALSMDPNQKIMDLIQSWALRAGRQYALIQNLDGHRYPMWAVRFNDMLKAALIHHTFAVSNSDYAGLKAFDILQSMVRWGGTTGTTPVERAREVLELLFPETDADDMPTIDLQCGDAVPDDEKGEQDEDNETSSGGAAAPETDEEDEEDEDNETSSGGAAAPETDEEDSDEGEDQSDDDGPGDGDAEGEEDTDEEDTDEDDDDGDPTDGDDGDDEEIVEVDADSPLAKELRMLEKEANDSEKETINNGDPAGPSGGDTPVLDRRGFRQPTGVERETQHKAERFLRSLIAPSETSHVSLSDSPSSMVDPVAMAAWKAAGQRTAPTFFRRTHRRVEPTPPVKIAVLVDVSYSMSPLQHPSALLSWALSSAALDLRNFAGRGQQIESTLIHWGNSARVVQPNGQPLPGIKTAPCNEYTSAMSQALDLVDEQIPGFFDTTEKDENRLLVQFTDWELDRNTDMAQVYRRMSQALAAGVNMLTVAPAAYGEGNRTVLPQILGACPVQRGRSTLMRFDPKNPDAVWQQALAALK